jgi:hypothetical protein
MKRLTLSMPCFGRRKGTIRAIECIANQTANDWEALVIGDGCPIMEDFLMSGYFNDLRADCRKRGNDLYIANNPKNKGGHGYAITNNNIEVAEGKYFIFFWLNTIIALIMYISNPGYNTNWPQRDNRTGAEVWNSNY